MENPLGKIIGFVLIVLAAFLFFFGCINIAYHVGFDSGYQNMRIQAVKKGHAYWKTDDEGHSTFHWNGDPEDE